MNVLDTAPATAAGCNTLRLLPISQPHFTRATFTDRNQRGHTESRCNYCGFRITAANSDSFDNEEQEHAYACRGSWAE